MPLGTLAAPPGFVRSPGGVYRKRQQYERCGLHGRSGRVLNQYGNPYGRQNQFPSNYQYLGPDPDQLLKWMGDGLSYPAGVGLANVLAIYLCDTASPLVDSLGLGPNLVAAGGPLTGREGVGLGQAGSFTSKVGVETLGGADRFAVAADAAFADANNSIVSILAVARFRTPLSANGRVISKRFVGPVWWDSYFAVANQLSLDSSSGGGAVVNGDWLDGAWHNPCFVIDDVTKHLSLLTDLGDNNGAAYVGSLTNAELFSVGSWWGGVIANQYAQYAYLVFFDLALTSAMRANFWRHAQVAVPYLHARTNPMIAPISPSRVAAWSGGNVGQACLAYDASLASAANGNAQGSGYMAEDGATFEPIGSTDFYGNSTAQAGGVKASVDGPSGMRDGCRYTQGVGGFSVATGAYLPVVAIVGGSAVPWRQDVSYRRALVGTTARLGLQFIGSGAGAENFTAVISDAATPVDWTRNGGTVTPVNNDQNQVYYLFGATAGNGDCDFGEPALIKNRTTAPLAWRRVGTAAAAATVTPTYQVVNTANRYYFPLYGRQRIIIGQFQGTTGATFLQFGAPGAAGSLTLDYDAGPQLRLRIWDSAGALAVTILGGVLTAARTAIQIDWDVTAPLHGIGGAYAALTVGTTFTPPDGVVVGAWLAPWNAAVAVVTPLYFGSASGVNAARCLLELA